MKPAILGGSAAFTQPLPFTQPTLVPWQALEGKFKKVLSSGMLTKGEFVSHYEEKLAKYMGVKHAVAVSSCTLGLILSVQALGLTGEIIVPSFTFPATFHCLYWNQITPVFADCKKNTFNIDPEEVEKYISPRTSAILAVYIFGNPPEIDSLKTIAQRHKIKLIFDSAHAFGSLYKKRRAGSFGDVEVFSTSATKLLATGEGGVVATNDDSLALKVRMGREYGNPGDYDFLFAGLNARLPEFGAILGIEGLEHLEEWVTARNLFAKHYSEGLKVLPGISFQAVNPEGRSSYKDFGIVVEEENFGLSRDQLARALGAEGIPTRKYFYPPGHMQKAFQVWGKNYKGKLTATEDLSLKILCLPVYSHMKVETVKKVCEAVIRIYKFRDEVRQRLK